ncbi:hypothetical protein GGI43DRAFT_253141 [Trichoderma evansii]
MENPHKLIYQPLRGDQIRLLTLASGLPNAGIQCFFEVVYLDHIGNYDGLSYTWRLEISNIDISLNNGSMPVTRNLNEALKALRLTTHPRKIWKFFGGSDLEPLYICKERRFVGEPYIHGLLDGERFDESHLEEISLS